MLRAPRYEDFALLQPNACLMSMLHYPTRPARVERLRSLGLNAISLELIANDEGLRLVENMRPWPGTGWRSGSTCWSASCRACAVRTASPCTS